MYCICVRWRKGERLSQEIWEAKAGISDIEIALQKEEREFFCTTMARPAKIGTCRGSGGEWEGMLVKWHCRQSVRSVKGGHVIPAENPVGIILLGKNDHPHRKSAMHRLSQPKRPRTWAMEKQIPGSKAVPDKLDADRLQLLKYITGVT